jgi:hypothetical protein
MTDPIMQDMTLMLDQRAQAADGGLVLLSRTGSRAYGTDNENSDHDFRGVYVADLRRLFSLSGVNDSIDIDDPHDAVIYELGHFARLAYKANPTALELLWSDDYESAGLGDELRSQRKLFLSKRVLKTYGGYALSQIEKAKRGTGGSRGADHHKRMKFKLHTLRLLQEGIHILRHNDGPMVRLPNTDALFDMAAQDIEVVEAQAQNMLATMDYEAEHTLLPDHPDVDAINHLIYNLRINHWRGC